MTRTVTHGIEGRPSWHIGACPCDRCNPEHEEDVMNWTAAEAAEAGYYDRNARPTTVRCDVCGFVREAEIFEGKASPECECGSEAFEEVEHA